MANFKKTLTIEIEVCSGASEADINQYGEELVEDIKGIVNRVRFDSWRQEIYTDYDSSEKVDLTITVK